jgi:large subunit ribosomal protein L24
MKNALKRGDEVVIIAGDDRGKSGKILKILRAKDRVLVEGVAIAKKHGRKSQEYPDGAIFDKPMSVHRSNVMSKATKEQRLAKRNKNA